MESPLSSKTRAHLDALFAEDRRAEAERLLVERCGANLPLWHDTTPAGLERIRFAALKLSEGSLAELRAALRLANEDWRDALVAAGFAEDVDAHRRWRPGGARP